MIDGALRPLKDRVFAPLAAVVARRCGPTPITVVALGVGLAAAGVAASGLVLASVVLWWANRFLDGLDGAVARRRGVPSDLGGYRDILADTAVYAAVPIGVALAVDDRAAWVAVAALLATLYVNAVSWTYLAAVLEKRGAGAVAVGTPTSVRMPTGVVEGAETVVLYTVVLAVPAFAAWTFGAVAVLVGVTVVQRLVAAGRLLR